LPNCATAEQIGFGFFTEIGFDNACLAATIGGGIRQRKVTSLARLVLVHRDQMGHPATLGVGAAHRVAWCLGRHHPHVQIGTGLHKAIVHVKAVGKHQRSALLDVGCHVFLVDLGNLLVGQQDHDHVCGLHGIGHLSNLQTSFLDLGPGSAALAQAHHHVDATVVQVLGMGMALGTVANDGHRLAFDQTQVCILVIKNLHNFLLR
jgi:hypothetical protein